MRLNKNLTTKLTGIKTTSEISKMAKEIRLVNKKLESLLNNSEITSFSVNLYGAKKIEKVIFQYDIDNQTIQRTYSRNQYFDLTVEDLF